MDSGRRCRRRALDPGAPRPSDVVAVFFTLALGFFVAAAVAGAAHAAGWAPGRWLALHLAFVGGVSQLVIGASQFFTGAFLATSPPPRRLLAAQLIAWNIGAVLVALALPTGAPALASAGGTLLLAGLALYAAGLRTMQRRSLQRAPWAARWYYACAVFLAVGAVAGVLLARGTAWSGGDLLAAHLALNVGGWFGTAIVGTLHTFYPSLTHTRLRFPRLQPATFAAWTAGVAALAAGHAAGVDAVAAAGWLVLLLAAALLSVNLVACARAAEQPLSQPARLVGLGHVALVAGLVLSVVAAIVDGASAPLSGGLRPGTAALLLAGWLALTVLGSLLHLLLVVRRVRDLASPLAAPHPVRDRGLPLLAAAGVALLGAGVLLDLDALALAGAAALLAAYGVLALRILATAGQVLARGGLRL